MFLGRPKKRALRIDFATDIHGSDRCFRKFLAAAESYEADALILGGDIAGKGLVPIRSHNGSLSAKVRGEPVTVPLDEERRLRAEINRLGFYSLIADDREAELDPQLRPVIRGGRPSIIPVGSKAVRDVIKRYQPVVGLHGHIHESKGAQKIGSTMCLNPGSDYSADVLRGAIVDFADDGSYIDFLFTTG